MAGKPIPSTAITAPGPEFESKWFGVVLAFAAVLSVHLRPPQTGKEPSDHLTDTSESGTINYGTMRFIGGEL